MRHGIPSQRSSRLCGAGFIGTSLKFRRPTKGRASRLGSSSSHGLDLIHGIRARFAKLICLNFISQGNRHFASLGTRRLECKGGTMAWFSGVSDFDAVLRDYGRALLDSNADRMTTLLKEHALRCPKCAAKVKLYEAWKTGGSLHCPHCPLEWLWFHGECGACHHTWEPSAPSACEECGSKNVKVTLRFSRSD